MENHERLDAYWQRFCDSLPDGQPCPQEYTAWHFSDYAESADELAALVRAGTKQATASLAWTYEFQEERFPRPGDISMIVNWAGEPQCIIETTGVEVLPFDQVPAEFAAEEGEGDRSLEWWRQAHWDFFSRECATIGRQPALDMPVICERFRVIFR